MGSQEVQTVNSKADLALVTVAVAAAVVGVLGFSLLTEQPLLVRIAVLAVGLGAALAAAWFSLPGKQFLEFARDSYEEARRVVWPSRKETLNTTGVVFAFVVLMAIFLFFVDMSVEWVLYDLVLRWK